jgi:hypothetical protein
MPLPFLRAGMHIRILQQQQQQQQQQENTRQQNVT